ncbi:hypothetical protein GCM10025866_03110 [Naasia aerilata]|uniref:Uncharacterized protein n=2 Tax=Naasia aerilata TaxID=1162966 RepID=A0ABN6XKW8_9MICO|nr:hypothetical protein GCM10025866_03110 [Naasia aerilata]
MGSALEEGLRAAEQYTEAGARADGATRVESVQIQRVDSTDRLNAVTAYVCVDVSEVDVVDSSGRSLVSPDRDPRVLFLVTAGFDADVLKISKRSVWADQC